MTRFVGCGVAPTILALDPHHDRIRSATPVPSPQALAFKWASVWVVELERDSVVRID